MVLRAELAEPAPGRTCGKVTDGLVTTLPAGLPPPRPLWPVAPPLRSRASGAARCAAAWRRAARGGADWRRRGAAGALPPAGANAGPVEVPLLRPGDEDGPRRERGDDPVRAGPRRVVVDRLF